jgi:hypothetical protein
MIVHTQFGFAETAINVLITESSNILPFATTPFDRHGHASFHVEIFEVALLKVRTIEIRIILLPATSLKRLKTCFRNIGNRRP